MPRICYLTGKSTKSGHSRSHSMTATKRKFKPNILSKWVKLEDGSKVRIKLCSKIYKKMRGFIG